MAAWLHAHGYRIIRTPRGERAEQHETELIDMIMRLTDVRRVA